MASDQNSNEAPHGSVLHEREVSLLALLTVLAKHKFRIAAVTVTSGVLSAIIVFLLPNIYTGAAKVFPPQQNQSSAAMLLGQLGGLAALGVPSLGMKNPNDLYVGMLTSRTVADNVIKRFNLQELYERDTLVATRKKLAAETSIVAGKDGLITIEFDDRDPQRAAAVVNAYVDELTKLTQSLAVTEAAQRRLFFERQLQQAKEGLSNAEVALRATQEKTGLIKLDDQGKAIIEAVAALRAQIAAKEVEVRGMRTFATGQHPEYVRAVQQLAGLRSELGKLERAQIAGEGDVLLPTGRVPEAGLEYLRKLRDVKYHEAIFELMAKQFEAAKIDEAKEAAIIQIVDEAIAPDAKSKPRRALIIGVSSAIGCLLGVLLTLLRDLRERASAAARAGGRHAAFPQNVSSKR